MTENLPENTPPAYAAPAAPESKGLALSSMIVGIVSLVLAWPISIVGIIGGIVALILGIIGRRRGQSKGMTLAGIITGSLAIVLGVVAMIVVALLIGAALTDPAVQEQLQELENAQ